MIDLYTMEFEIPLISLLFIIMLIVVYFSKSSINSVENKIFRVMLIATISEVFLDFLVHAICSVNTFQVITSIAYYNFFNIVNKFIIICFGIIFESLFCYILTITYGKEVLNKRILKMGISGVNILLLMILPFTNINIINAGTASNVTGSTPLLGYAVIAFFLTLSFITTVKNFKNIDRRYLPIIIIFIVLLVCYLATIFLPGIILYDFAIVLLCYLMYFTIENPDMKLLKEVHDAKEISDNANEEKSLFLYNITQEVRDITKNIDDCAGVIIDSDSLEESRDVARNIKGETSKFRMIVNDIFDISAVEASSIKIYNDRYNIKTILKKVINIYNRECLNKGLEFRTNIEHDLPDMLYGDGINLKKVLSLILTNSLKYTNKGYVELDVNMVKKGDIVRLIITIEDSGVGIKSSEIKEISVGEGKFREAYRLVTLMSGTLMLSSNYGVGTKVKIVLDQRIGEDRKESDEYDIEFDNMKIMVVDDNETTIKIMEKLLRGSKVDIDGCLNGREVISKIKSKNKYDVILLDEELSKISGKDLIKKLHEIRNFNVPLVLLTKDNRYEYMDEYKKMGFDDYILRPFKKEEVLKILDKYSNNR